MQNDLASAWVEGGNCLDGSRVGEDHCCTYRIFGCRTALSITNSNAIPISTSHNLRLSPVSIYTRICTPPQLHCGPVRSTHLD